MGISNFLTKRILMWILDLKGADMFKFLDGYKSKIGGIGLIFGGLALAANSIVNGEYTRLLEAGTMIAAGFGVLGLAGKAQAIVDNTKK